MAHILIAEARFYAHLSDMLLAGARGAIEAAGHSHETIMVPGALELPLLSVKVGPKFQPGLMAWVSDCGTERIASDQLRSHSAGSAGVQGQALVDGSVVAMRLSQITSRPRSDSRRINRPAPCFNATAASGKK